MYYIHNYTYCFYLPTYLHFMYFKDNNLVYPRKKNYPVLPTTQLAFKAKQADSSVGSEVLF